LITAYNGKKLKSPNEIKGFETLPGDKKIQFESMLPRFYNGWEFPEKWVPRKVSYVSKENYIRVDFSNKRWLHFYSNGTWA
jgi:hypothetical protein